MPTLKKGEIFQIIYLTFHLRKLGEGSKISTNKAEKREI
jgi:hypothetical protein